MSEIPNHPVFAKNILEMITVAHDYCATISKIENKPKSEVIDYLIKVSPLLYIKGVLMNDIEVSNPDANERFVSEEEWETIFNDLRNKFGKDDEFWFIDNAENHNDPIKGSLAEHYTDIFQDFQDFLILYQKNSIDAKENAVAELKSSFISNWGYRLVTAHKTLHHLFLKTEKEPPKFDIPELF